MDTTQHDREPEAVAGVTSIAPSPLADQVAPGGSARVLEQLRWAFLENRAEFRRIAELEEPNVEVRHAIRALLGVSPEVHAALGEVMRLPAEDLQLIAATLALPAEVQATLRALIA
jgi:hypothetical protein